MKDEPWRGDPALRVQHLERKLGNKRKRLAQLEAGLAAANKRVAELEGVVSHAIKALESLPEDCLGTATRQDEFEYPIRNELIANLKQAAEAASQDGGGE